MASVVWKCTACFSNIGSCVFRVRADLNDLVSLAAPKVCPYGDGSPKWEKVAAFGKRDAARQK